jgi:hypothetical protein
MTDNFITTADDRPIVLHVGGMKTGSSALQYDLTWQPVRSAVNAREPAYEYVSLLPSQTLRAAQLQQHAANFAAHYSMSTQIHSLLEQPAEGLAAGLAGLERVHQDGRVPILSYETWLTAAPDDIHAFTRTLGGQIRVVAYVRPPVQWLASLFYQRDYTREINFTRFLTWISKACWVDSLDNWKSAPFVERVEVRLHGPDICTDFCRLLECEPSGQTGRHNRSLPAVAAELLERYQPPANFSLSEAKFALWRWLPANSPLADQLAPAPFPFDQHQVTQIIAETRCASMRLLESCDAATRQAIEADARWWSDDPEVHGLATATQPAVLPSPPANTDAFTLLLWECLLKADAAWRQAWPHSPRKS